MKTLKMINKYFSIFLFIIIMAATSLSGCNHEREVVPPPTYPVKGKLIVPNGKIPGGHLIQFDCGNPKCMAEGLIEGDGTFKLVTRYEGVVCEGAVEGEYFITIVPPMSSEAMFSSPKRLPRSVRIKPEPNDVTISLSAS